MFHSTAHGPPRSLRASCQRQQQTGPWLSSYMSTNLATSPATSSISGLHLATTVSRRFGYGHRHSMSPEPYGHVWCTAGLRCLCIGPLTATSGTFYIMLLKGAEIVLDGAKHPPSDSTNVLSWADWLRCVALCFAHAAGGRKGLLFEAGTATATHAASPSPLYAGRAMTTSIGR